MKSLLLAALLLGPSAPPESLVLTDAVAVKALPAPWGCGINMTWAAIDFSHAGNIYRVYYMCALDEELPREGARCTIRTHRGPVREITADRRQDPSDANILDSMTCDPPAEAAHHEYPRATITGYGPMPDAKGGSAYQVRPVRVTTARGERLTLYFVHGRRDAKGRGLAELEKERPYPAIGETCDISTSASLRYRWSYRGSSPEELIYAINC